MSEPLILTVSRRFDAAPDRVFDAWLDPDLAARFLFATDGGAMQRVEIDSREGGAFLIVERRAAGDAAHHGRYLTINRPRRLVFLFAAGGPDDDPDTLDWSRVTIVIEPDGDGALLTLTHEMDAAWADYADRTRAGWTMILGTLGEIL